MRGCSPRPRLQRVNALFRWFALASAAVAAVFSMAGTAGAEVGDLRKLAVDWARGRYNSPLVCEIDGELIRGLRRLLVTPAPRQSVAPMGRLIFVEMETDRASRCFTDLGAKVVNLKGTLKIRLPGPPRPDSARRELKGLLKRERAVTFDVVSGVLQETPIGKTDADSRSIDFAGGTARFETVREGSDPERLLADYKSPRKFRLEVRSPDGAIIDLPIFLADFR